MEIEAYILIGGVSRRFGRDKAGVRIGETSLVERTARTVTEAVSPTKLTLVAASPGQVIGVAGPELDLPFVFDLYEGRGPIGGLHAALAYARTTWVLVLACDLPLVSPALLKYLADLAADDLDAIVPVQPDGNLQPLCAVYRRASCLPIVEEPLIAKRTIPPIREIFDRLRTRFVGVDEIQDMPGAKNFFLNMNTPADYEAARHLLEDSR